LRFGALTFPALSRLHRRGGTHRHGIPHGGGVRAVPGRPARHPSWLGASLFIYLVAWWGLQWLAVKLGEVVGLDSGIWYRWTANLVPAGIILVLAFAIPLVINAPHERKITQLQATDVQSSGIIKLPAVVAIDLPKASHTRGWGVGPFCEALCLRLLYNGVVSRVVAVARWPDGKVELASYGIERRDLCPKVDLPRTLIVWLGEHRASGGTRRMRVEDRVQARIAAGECLVRDAGRIEDAGTIISVRNVKPGLDVFRGPWNLWLDTVNAQRLEIAETDDRVLYRRTEINAALLAEPLRSTAGGGFFTTVTYAGWARRQVVTQPLGPDGRDILPGLLGEEASRPPDLPDTVRP
jgi:hypothetical protein